MSEWRPISTAPKDGTFVLICQPSGYVTVAQFCIDDFWRSHVDQDPWQAFTPRWWMPLPRPPQEPK